MNIDKSIGKSFEQRRAFPDSSMAFDYALAILVFGIASCNVMKGSALHADEGRILGGNITIVKPHSQPWVVGIIFSRISEKIRCGGTLLSKKHVISAAHCEVMSYGGATHVVVGEHDQTKEDGQQKIEIANRSMLDKDYDVFHNPDPDMIIYELKQEVNNQFAKPASLPKEDERFDTYTVSGWGHMNLNEQLSEVLRSVQLSDIGQDNSCYKIGGLFNPKNTICGENQQDIVLGPCNGDSGGPWVSRNDRGEVVLAGVHKGGRCKRHEVSHAAAQVSYPPYLAWIKKEIGIKN